MASLSSLILFALLSVAVAVSPKELRGQNAVSFVKSLDFNMKLRICNAYAAEASSFFVYLNQVKLNEKPLEYKACMERPGSLQQGDIVNFKLDTLGIGAFTIAELPRADATLALVIHRHDTSSMAVGFKSHVFAKIQSPQVAILDTYKGAQHSMLQLQAEAKKEKDGEKKEGEKKQKVMPAATLEFNTVAAVDPGAYKVSLKRGADTEAEKALITVPGESYVVLRCGVEAEAGSSWPEEVVVYPTSVQSAAAGVAPSVVMLLAVTAGLFF